ncbi:replication protein A 70 kDa DNA-binding subunit-like [Senna tora]|uniref:Replication protein A 70 kDa DNA-binding subunit-like n=1 Tax=Senna tora TaxID=362788 RepID=A0A834TF37_9FABA|nr:replication protein A 70 kDa DNA-binding subunit-like [Senna tora]
MNCSDSSIPNNIKKLDVSKRFRITAAISSQSKTFVSSSILPAPGLSNCILSNTVLWLFIILQWFSSKVLSAFGANSSTGHESVIRMWKDELHGIPSSLSVYDTLHHTRSPIQQPLLDVSQIYDRYIHINGILYWISATETADTSNSKKLLIAFNIAKRTWVSYDVSINMVGDQFYFCEVDGLVGIITWTSGSLEITRHYNLFVKRNSSNGTTIFRKVDLNKGVCYKDVFSFPGGELCDMVKIVVPKPHKTKVQKSSDDVPIQYFGFDFVNLRSIKCGVVDSTILIGLVRNISNIRRKFFDNFQTNRIPIEIYDACGNVLQVVLCGIHCQNFRSFIRNFSGGRIIVVIQWCKVADFHGSKYLTTSMEATRLLINEDIMLLNFDSTRSWSTLRAIQKDSFVEIYPSNIFNPAKSFISMDSKNLTGKTKQPLTSSLNLPSTKRSRGHEAENEDNLKFSQRSALSDITNVTQTQQISLPHNSLIVQNYFYQGYQTHMPPHIGFTPLVLSPGNLKLLSTYKYGVTLSGIWRFTLIHALDPEY